MQAPGVRNRWNITAEASQFTNIISQRNCSRTILASNGSPSLGTGRSWQYSIVPVDPSDCMVVNLVAKRRPGEDVYLATKSDCERFQWFTRGVSKYSQFELLPID